MPKLFKSRVDEEIVTLKNEEGGPSVQYKGGTPRFTRDRQPPEGSVPVFSTTTKVDEEDSRHENRGTVVVPPSRV